MVSAAGSTQNPRFVPERTRTRRREIELLEMVVKLVLAQALQVFREWGRGGQVSFFLHLIPREFARLVAER
jgi:hypothetical protein